MRRKNIIFSGRNSRKSGSLLLILFLIIAYILMFKYLYPVFGNSLGAVVFLPIVFAGWKLGYRMGIIVAFLTCVINIILYTSELHSGWYEVLINSLPPFTASLLAGGISGWFHALHDEIKQKTEALSREHAALEEESARHKLTLENLKWNETLLRTMAEASDVGYLAVDSQADKILYFNHSFLRIWKIEHLEEKIRNGEYTNSQLMLLSHSILKSPPQLSEQDAREFAESTSSRDEEVEFSDGRIIRMYEAPAVNGVGGNIRFCVFIDVTRYKKIENELRTSRTFLERIINSIGDPLFVKDSRHRLILLNDRFASLFGFSKKELLGSKTGNFPGKEKVKNIYYSDDHLMDSGEEVVTENLYTDAAGIEHFLITKKNLFEGNSPEEFFVVGTIRDVTSQRKAEAELIKALEKERELNRLRSNFITTVSHEYRTPLTCILSSAELLGMGVPEEKKSQLINNIAKSVDDMTRMLNEVLAFNSLESGRIKFRPEEVDVIGFCRGMLQNANEKYGGKCRAILNTATDSLYLMLDGEIIKHILDNFLSNAFKYSPDGGEIELNILCSKDSVSFTVKDSGVGISDDDKSRIFEPFYRGPKIAHIPGSGLGLSIARHLAELHGGYVTFESRENFGSSFVLTLPAN